MTDPKEQRRWATEGTWQAYNSMEATKQRHFELMTALETRKTRFNLEPSPAEQEMLASLLEDHDAQVRAFTVASNDLKQRDPAAHAALFEHIGRINTMLHRFRRQDSH